MKFTFSEFKLIRLYLSLISFLFAPVAIIHANAGDEYKEFICKAFKDTYKEGVLKYKLLSRALTSDGDTFTIQSMTTVINSKKGIDFTSISNDSLMLVYLDNQLLYVNLSKNTYNKAEVKQRDIEDNVEIIYLPLLHRKFEKSIFSGKTITEKLSEDDKSINFKVSMVNTGDVGNLFFLITISKPTNTVLKYSYSASVSKVAIWEEYSMLSLEQLLDPNAGEIVKEDYSNVISNFNYRTNKSPKDNPDSMKVEINLLTQELPYYDLVSIEGDTFKISNVKSKHYLIDFWYRSCYPCIKVVPVLKELENKYSNTELKIVSINPLDKNLESVKDFINENSIPFDVYTSSVQKGRKFSGVNSYPFFIFYDSKFRVISTFSGYSDELMQRIEKMIAN